MQMASGVCSWLIVCDQEQSGNRGLRAGTHREGVCTALWSVLGATEKSLEPHLSRIW